MQVVPQSEIKQALNLPYGGARKMAAVLGISAAAMSCVLSGKKRFGHTVHNRFTDITGYVIEWTHEKKRRWAPDWKK